MLRRVLEQRRANAFNTLVDLLVPQQVPPATVLMEARMLGAAKEAVINSKSYVTAREIAEIAGYSGSNPSSQPNKWKREKLIFAFNHGGVDYFPAYALDPETAGGPTRRWERSSLSSATRREGGVPHFGSKPSTAISAEKRQKNFW
jgi:hypothetical protein